MSKEISEYAQLRAIITNQADLIKAQNETIIALNRLLIDVHGVKVEVTKLFTVGDDINPIKPLRWGTT